MHQLFISLADKYIPSDISKALKRLPSGTWNIAPFSLQSWRDPDLHPWEQIILLHFGGIRLLEEQDGNTVIELTGTDIILDKWLRSFISRNAGHYESRLIVLLFADNRDDKIAQAISRLLEEQSGLSFIVHVIIARSSDATEDTAINRNSINRQLSMLAEVIGKNFSIGELLQHYPGALHFKTADPTDNEIHNRTISTTSAAPEDLPPSDLRIPVQRKNPLTAWIREYLFSLKTIGFAAATSIPIVRSSVQEQPAKSSKSNDEVNCTLFAPKTVVPSNEFMVQVFVHTSEQKALLEEMARITDPATSLGASTELDELITPGTRLTLQLSISSMIIEEPVLHIKWKGNASSVQFTVKVPADAPPSDVIGKVLVLKDSVPIGVLKFKISIGTRAGTTNEQVQSGMKHFKKAFISYASQDRAEVLRRVQMLNLIQLPFFQDLLTLEAGDQWEPQIFKNIADSDVFFLFWSKAASASQWVRKEVLYARELQCQQELPEIIPVIIEGPPVIAPPEELAFMHFNDKMIYFIHAEQ